VVRFCAEDRIIARDSSPRQESFGETFVSEWPRPRVWPSSCAKSSSAAALGSGLVSKKHAIP
jgi:hypothetical protein